MSAFDLGSFPSLRGPVFEVFDAPATSIDDLALTVALHPDDGIVLRVLRGTRMRTDAEAFVEMAAALQFPSYAGPNWNAVLDCLRDLQWLPARAYLIVITRADRLFAATDDGALESLVTTINAAAEYWRAPATGPLAHAATPFSVLLHAADVRGVRRRFTAAGASFD